MGRWHLKSLVVTTCLILAILYYTHRMDFKPGSKIKKRDLVVRAGKPYKSPYSRRKHTRLFKDEKSALPVKHRGNESLSQFPKKPGSDMNKTKSESPQLPRPNGNKVHTKNALLQRLEKYSGVSKSKANPNVASFSQVNPGESQILETSKGIHKIENKKYPPRISEALVKNVTNTKVSDQTVSKTNGFIHQLSGNGQENKVVKASNAVLYDNTNHMTQKSTNEVSGDMRFKPLPKPVVKIKQSIGEGHVDQTA